jgi:hypothetical protein
MEMLPGAAHHFVDDAGQVLSKTPEFHPIASITKHFIGVDIEKVLARLGDKTHVVWTLKPNLDENKEG